MNETKRDLKLLLIYVAIGIIAAGTTAYFLYPIRMELWRAHGCDTFREALKGELQKRSGIEVYFASSGNVGLPTEKGASEKVTMDGGAGMREYIIPYFKLSHNIEDNFDQRILHGYILEKHPLKVDSLNMVWNDLLTKKGFNGETVIRISVTDWLEHEASTYSHKVNEVAKSDSLVSYYIGYRCEIGVTGYLLCSWWKVFTVKDVVLLCAIIIGCFLVFFFGEYIVRGYQRFLVMNFFGIAKKDASAIAIGKTQGPIYELEDDISFFVNIRRLARNGHSFVMTQQPTNLLQGFIEAKDHRLSIEEIAQLLWPGDVVTSVRVHKVIERLRNYLAKISDWTIENGNLGYQLKSPVPSKKIIKKQ